jgi:hypothetical protein
MTIWTQLTDGATQITCNLWSVSPGRLLASGGRPRAPLVSVFSEFMNNLCRDQPGYVGPTFAGTQDSGLCPVLYNVSSAWQARNRDTDELDTGSLTAQVLGPITIVGTINPNPGFRGFFIRNGAGQLVQMSDIYSDSLWSGFSATITGMSRVDGLPDDCGDPLLYPPPPGLPADDEDGIDLDFNLPVPGAPIIGVNLNIRIALQPPSIILTYNGGDVVEINGGGFNFNVGGSLSQQVNINPEFEAEITNSLDIINFNTNLTNDTVNNVNNTTQGTNISLEALTNTVNSIADTLGVSNFPVNSDVTGEDGCTLAISQSENLAQLFGTLFREVYKVNLKLCNELNLTRQLIGTGVSTVEERAFYLTAPDTAVFVELVIVGELPPNAKYFQTNEATGNWGEISQTNTNNSRLTGTTVFTRNTLLRLTDDIEGKRIRLFLIAGVTWEVYAFSEV